MDLLLKSVGRGGMVSRGLEKGLTLEEMSQGEGVESLKFSVAGQSTRMCYDVLISHVSRQEIGDNNVNRP